MFKVKLLVQVPSLVTFTPTVITIGELVVILVTSQTSLLPFWVNFMTSPPMTLYLPAYSKPSGKLSTKFKVLLIVILPVFRIVKL